MDTKQFSPDKILKHLDRINDWFNGKNPFAITVEFSPTNLCNSYCKFCSDRSRTEFVSINLEDGKRIIKELKESGAKGLTFTGGGEPLCNPATINLIEYANEIGGFDIGLITNGICLTKTICEVLTKACLWVRISLDAGTPEMYKLTHGLEKEVFNDVLKNIRLLVQTKRERNSSTIIGAGYLTGDETINGILSFVKLSRELGVDYVQIRPYHHSKYNPRIEEAIQQAQQFSDDQFNVLASKHKYASMKQNDYNKNYKICYGHQFATFIGADMKMYICCHTDGLKKFCFGDLKKNSLKDIWNSKQRQKAIQNINLEDSEVCIPLCRCDGFNRILWIIKQPIKHLNFL